jgi:hypothetical protein
LAAKIGRDQIKNMSDIVINENGKIRKVADVEIAEKIIKDRKFKDYWDVIDSLVRLWAKTAPEDEEAMKINIEQYRESLHDKEFGQTLMGADQERRFTMAFPRSLMLMIRTQYKADELPMDKEFFKEFGKRYPAFKIAERS